MLLLKNNSTFYTEDESGDILNIEGIEQTRENIIEGGSIGKEEEK